jgi:cytidine deaminase
VSAPRLAGVELYFEDLERAKGFYREALGLPLVEEGAARFAKFAAGEGFLCCEKKGTEPYPSADRAVVFLEVPDLAAAVARLGERVVKHEAGGARPWAVLHDPEGHNVLLLERARGDEALVAEALAARERAYAPYSKFAVGAAVLAEDGRVYRGCNVENASYPLGVCAERNAIAAMVAGGARRALVVAVIADQPEPVTPCGGCRQVLREFGREARVVLANVRGARVTTTLEALLPRGFGPEHLGVRP